MLDDPASSGQQKVPRSCVRPAAWMVEGRDYVSGRCSRPEARIRFGRASGLAPTGVVGTICPLFCERDDDGKHALNRDSSSEERIR